MIEDAVSETQLEGLTLFKRGKVRDVYDLGEHLLIVATDRISAFDVVLPTAIPSKGTVLTQLSAFWFTMMRDLIPTHLVSAEIESIVGQSEGLRPHRNFLAGRSMLVEKTEVIPIECVIRGYLAGSGWKEYQRTQSICGIPLPPGLKESEELPTPIFTPATKEESGHDLNITEEEMARRIGAELTQQLKKASLAIYTKAVAYAETRGIILADTKFEFGRRHGQVLLIDELLTPDSSRFWPKEQYEPGQAQVSFDKQYVRDYLEEIGWDKTPPAPALPNVVVLRTSAKYLQALQQLTGQGISPR